MSKRVSDDTPSCRIFSFQIFLQTIPLLLLILHRWASDLLLSYWGRKCQALSRPLGNVSENPGVYLQRRITHTVSKLSSSIHYELWDERFKVNTTYTLTTCS